MSARADHRIIEQASPLQRRFWLLNELHPSAAHHVVAAHRIVGDVDRGRLEDALAFVVDRHEALRTAVRRSGVDFVQVVHQAADIRLVGGSAPYGPESVADFVARPFDLGSPPLVRALLLKTSPHQSIFVLVMHHAAVDGWSVQLIERDISRAFSGATLTEDESELRQFRDYCAWTRAPRNVAAVRTSVQRWRERIPAGLGPLSLNCYGARAAKPRHKGSRHTEAFSPRSWTNVTNFARANRTTVFTVYLAALALVLNRRSGLRDFVVGTSVANRPLPMFDQTVGPFVNTVPIVINLPLVLSGLDLLRAAADWLMESLSWKDAPFDLIVQAVRPQRSVRWNPLIQIMLFVQPFRGHRLNLAGATTWPFRVDSGATGLDLMLLIEPPPVSALEAVIDVDLISELAVGELTSDLLANVRLLCEEPSRKFFF
jgi:hypothetical protein